MPHPFENPPDTFWDVRVHDLALEPSLTGLCVGYELAEWRAEQFATHMMEWLPEFALSAAELTGLNSGNMVRMMREAARKIYDSEKFRNRGEFGELFLHAAVRSVFGSIPAISKIFYKTSANDTVKGFDAVHVVGPPDDMELWIGEVKFYKEISSAIRDVVAELQIHTERDYLRDEFIWIKGKIDPGSPHASQLNKLLSPGTSLDVVFKRACIPVLLTYESECVRDHTECDASYISRFGAEIRQHHAKFVEALSGANLPRNILVRMFLLPLSVKETLVSALDRKLRLWQER